MAKRTAEAIRQSHAQKAPVQQGSQHPGESTHLEHHRPAPPAAHRGPDQPAPEELLPKMLTGYWISTALYVVAKLGLADLLAHESQTADQLAQKTAAHARSLYRVLRALASVGVFAEDDDGRFHLTPLADLLRSDVPGSLRAMAIMMGEEHFQCYGNLMHSVRTGQPAFEKLFGQPVFPYLQAHPEQAAIFDQAMVGIHGRETAAMLRAYDFADIGLLADIGGGNGSLLCETLKACPHLSGLLFDQPTVIERAQEIIRASGLADRCRAIGGSFFESVPNSADAYLLRHIIHDWDDDKAITILRNVRKAIPSNGRILIVENVIPPGNGPHFGKLLDLTMLVMPGGQERTAEEYQGLCSESGFHLTRIIPTAAETSIIEGRPT